MNKKEELKIALRLTEINDFVPTKDEIEDWMYGEVEASMDDILKVCEDYDGMGYSDIQDTIVDEYFKEEE